jgi:hypothetical protein
MNAPAATMNARGNAAGNFRARALSVLIESEPKLKILALTPHHQDGPNPMPKVNGAGA